MTKYTKPTDDSVPESDLKHITDRNEHKFMATVEGIQFADETRRAITSTKHRTEEYDFSKNGEFILFRYPMADILFSTSTTEFRSKFYCDMFEAYQNMPPRNSLSSLLSTEYLSWSDLPNLIGTQVTLTSPHGSSDVYANDPNGKLGTNIALEKSREQLYHNDISDLFIDIVYNWFVNSAYGYAEIVDYSIVGQSANVFFELKTGDNFGRRFRTRKDDLPSDKVYTIKDLCRTAVGYVPTTYNEIIGSEVEIQYSSKWKIADRRM